MEDPTKVINHLVRSLGVTAHQATAFIEVVQEIVEEHVTDDVSVLAPPLIVGRFGDPVLDRLAMRLEDPRWTLPESIDISPAELAAQLRLPVDVVEAYPIVGRFGILAKCLDRLSVSDEDAELHLRMLDTWLGTYAEEGGRDFRGLLDGHVTQRHSVPSAGAPICHTGAVLLASLRCSLNATRAPARGVEGRRSARSAG